MLSPVGVVGRLLKPLLRGVFILLSTRWAIHCAGEDVGRERGDQVSIKLPCRVASDGKGARDYRAARLEWKLR